MKNYNKVRSPFFLLLIVLAIPLTLFVLNDQTNTRSAAQQASFTFTAAGDHGVEGTSQASMNAVAQSGSQFYLALGDLSYKSGGEQNWCTMFKSKFNDVELIAGNHDVGESSGGDINAYRTHCPFTLGALTGDYGKQYYFDYPQSGTPLARFILIAPGVQGSLNINYNAGGAGYIFTESAINDARAKGIKWIIVGMHKNCISTGKKSCEIGQPIMNLLIDRKVDLVLQSHDHNYQRSHQLSCITVNSTNPACIADNGSDGTYKKDGGPVLVINGEFGRNLYAVNSSDSEAGYFAKTDASTLGISKYTISSTQLSAQYIKSGGGSFSDAFTITSSAAPPVNTATKMPAPTNIIPTFGCVSNEPCTTAAPTQQAGATPPGGGTNPGTNPGGGTTPLPGNPNPGTNPQPCPTNGTSGVFHNKKKVKSGGGFIEQFIKFILRFIELFFKLLGINIPNPGQIPQPNPGGKPCPEPTTGMQPTADPEPTVEPTIDDVQPTLGPTAPILLTTPPVGGGDTTPTATTCTNNGTGGSLNNNGWTLTGCDDFNGSAVDTSKWGLYNGPGHAGKGRRVPAQAKVANGLLTITGLPNGDTEGMAWQGGQKYGRWEGRVKAPVSDPSYNALLLLWPDAEDFPVGGEVDFMEMLDHTRQKTNFFLHYGANNDQLSGEVKIDGTQWHNWAVEWTPEHMIAYVDGKEWYKTTDTSKFPPRAMHITIQLDWFPKGGTVKQSEMQVDWIHIYRKN